MKKKMRQIYRNILKFLPTKIVMNIETMRGYGKLLNLKKPRFFGEKIQWIKLNGNLEKYSNLVDKYQVREKIEKEIGKKYLIDLVEVFDSVEEIDFKKLPNQFVLKLNTGSGYNYICKDKSELNEKKVRKLLKKWMNEDYYKIKKENQYKNIKKKIICEKYVEDSNGELLDYKFYTFNGKVEIIEVDFDRFTNHTMNFYDCNWNLLKLNKGKYQNYLGEVQKPKELYKMIEIAETLSKELPFARIDLYYVDDVIYFGEITLTPAGGLTPFKPLNKDVEYAQKIDLEKYKREKILYIASISKDNERLDGETVKNRLLKEALEEKFYVKTIDTHNWKKNFLKIIFEIFLNYHFSEKIVISASQTGASKIINFYRYINSKKKIYYFVIGGSLANHIKNGKRKVKEFVKLKEIIVESELLKSELFELGIKNVRVINNFRKIEESGILNIKENVTDNIKFIFFGRVIKEKGIEKAIWLINKLNSEGYKASLDIYGQVNDEYLKILNKQIELPDLIKYCGTIVPNGRYEYEILSNYDVFILPTEHEGEGLPGALIDSYISGLAVLVSNWKYAREYVEDNKNGFIFEYKNYDDMYEKAKMLFNKERLYSFKCYSKEKAKSFLIENVLKEFIKELEG